ncbi:preprotein translocase subunit YajC [Marinibaculum pumilum]|uniref:Sec translocon accessory complex subunit YajC n=1 Tax=Marinibaculum pumilum TaxID=1766165 RepID=A0ABV7KWC7_9PROT
MEQLMLVSPAYAQSAGGGGQGDFILQLLPLVLIFVVFYFLLIRPQQKKMKAHREMVGNVSRGDTVVTAGGIVGKVVKVVDENYAQVEIAENVRIKVVKSTISDVQAKGTPKGEGGESAPAKPAGEGDAAAKPGNFLSRFKK